MRKKTASRKSTPEFRFVSHSRDLPATQGMLQLVRSELKADIRELRAEVKSGFDQIDSRFAQMDSRFAQMDSKFAQMDSKFAQMDSKFGQVDSKFERVLSEVARVGMLVEEQNSRNRVVLEGLTGLWQRQDRVESRVEDVEKLFRSLARSK